MDLIKEQRSLIDKYYPEILTMDPTEATDLMVKAITGELSELLDGYQYLPWKKPVVLDKEYMIEESIDLLHFVLELLIIWGISSEEEMKDEYLGKLRVNFDRGRIHEGPHNRK